MRSNRLRNWAVVSVVCALMSVGYRLTAGGQVPIIGSTGLFQSLHITSGPALPLGSQGFYEGWNHNGTGESDFLTHQGGGTGGFCWFNGSTPTQLACLSPTGVMTAAGFVGPLTGNADTATHVPYSGLTGGVPTWNQNTTGTAAALTTAGTNCGIGHTAYGVDASANALCNTTSKVQSMYITTNICTTSGAETSCTSPTGGGFYNWPTTFSSSTYVVTCSFVGQPTGTGGNPGLYGPYIVGQTNAGIEISIQAGSNSAGGNNTVGGFYCIAQGN